ncbi:hypothetical protein KY338_05045 [Candidatus Woesearchaeota archaeon]|nr:hypothetical protein [Candidatus Woesearchaeota archaeon]MBW3006481.1 hypothetical protein [Candidatus Woesearchaeota archaeon]
MDTEKIISDLDVLQEYMTREVITQARTHDEIKEFIAILKQFFKEVSLFMTYFTGTYQTLQDLKRSLDEAKGSEESVALGLEVKNKIYELDKIKEAIPTVVKKYTKLTDKRQRHNIINKADAAVGDPTISNIFQRQIKANVIQICTLLLNISAQPTKDPKKNFDDIFAFFQALEIGVRDLVDNLEVLYNRRRPAPGRQYRIEASSYFRDQKNAYFGNGFKSVCIGLDKIKGFADGGQIPRTPQAGEPHCYGRAPNHLNSVVLGSDKRLVFYMYPDDNGTVIRLCAFIDSGTHNTALDALNSGQQRPGNLYWCIITKLPNHKIDRTFFEDFREIEIDEANKTLKDL